MSWDEERQGQEDAGGPSVPARRPPAEVGFRPLPPDRRPSATVVRRPGTAAEIARASLGLLIGLLGVAEGLVAAALNEVTRGTRGER